MRNFNYRWAILIGVGMALSPIHNKWLTNLVTDSSGEIGFFLPAFGYSLLILATGLFFLLHNNWREAIKFKNKRIEIPLLVIVVAIGLSGVTAEGWSDKFAPLGTGMCFYALYLASRELGKDIFKPLMIGVIIASIGIVISAVSIPGKPTGGIVFDNTGNFFGGNYDAATGYILFGVALFAQRWQWTLVDLALLAMFLSGSAEGVFACGIACLAIIIRKDWSKRLIYALTPTIIVAVIWFSMGWGQELYNLTYKAITFQSVNAPVPQAPTQPLPHNPLPKEETVIGTGAKTIETSTFKHSSIGVRVEVIKQEMADIQPFGAGYNLTGFHKVDMVHNVPLVIVQQLGYAGVLAGLCWLWIIGWCLYKTRWRYAFIMLLALSVFDHYIWTQMAPWWWALVGVSTASDIKTDLIFKEV